MMTNESAPLNEPAKPAAQKIVIDLKQGYPKGCLLPTLTVVIGVTLSASAIRHFCIDGTMMDKSRPPIDRDAYYEARRDYNDGNLDSAAELAGKILAKQPNHAEANQLMARISLARGDRERALDYLHRSLDTSLDREQVAKWISSLEALHSK